MLTLKKKLWIVNQKERGMLTDQKIASAQHVTRMTVHRIWKSYRGGREYALLPKSKGRKVDMIPALLQHKILQLRKKEYGIHKIRGLLQQQGVQTSVHKIMQVLSQHQLARLMPDKGRRYHYIRWERKHSNSLWQTDYCWIEKLGCWLTG